MKIILKIAALKKLKLAIKPAILLAHILLITALVFSSQAHARDPFSPFSSSEDSKKKDAKNTDKDNKKSDAKASKNNSSSESYEERKPSISITNPLVTAPLDNYKVAAVMLTPKEAYSAIKAPNGIQFIAKKGDKVGNEGGKIEEITIEYVKVKNGEDEVKIPVSNYAEAVESVEITQ